MGVAGVINMSMLVIAASLFHGSGLADVDTIEGAHAGFGDLVGPGAALAFALALLASGFAASSVGTYAGQVVMQGFIDRTIPLIVRRAVTMAPALVVLGIGLDPSRALVLSQVVLSFGIPFALVPLVLLTRRRDVMGALVNRPLTTALASTVAALIIASERLFARSDVRLGSLDSKLAREDHSPAMAAHAIGCWSPPAALAVADARPARDRRAARQRRRDRADGDPRSRGRGRDARPDGDARPAVAKQVGRADRRRRSRRGTRPPS